MSYKYRSEPPINGGGNCLVSKRNLTVDKIVALFFIMSDKPEAPVIQPF
jgi:hypothetical protein